RIQSGSGSLAFQETKLFSAVAPSGAKVTARGTRPDHFFITRHLKELLSLRVSDQEIAIGQALAHAAFGGEKGCPVFSGVRPWESLSLQVVLQHPRAMRKAEVVKNQQVAILKKLGVMLAAPGPACRP